jgi:uncharacterized membrane protein (UPF0127 family)
MLLPLGRNIPLIRYGIAILAAIICHCFPLSATACPLKLPMKTILIKGHKLTIELAFTPKSRSCGLSNRYALDENHGMLFIFPNAAMQKFWMKDTHIPLSIAFISDSGEITNIEKMVPNQTHEQYNSSEPVRYVLEVNQGWFDSHGIEAGDTAEFNLPMILNIQ